jgi:hypothetical protein
MMCRYLQQNHSEGYDWIVSLSFWMFATDQKPADSIPNVASQPNPPKPPISLELERIQRRVGVADWQESGIWVYLCWMFGPKVNQEELISIGKLVAETLRIKLDRDARRRKAVMIKWFEEHWIEIQPLLWYIKLEDVEANREERTVN